MKKQLETDLLGLAALLERVKSQGVHYLNNIADKPTSVKVTAAKSRSLPSVGFGTLETLQLFNKYFEPIMVASGGPRYWGFVTGGATPAAVVGDWLATIYDQNTQSAKGQGDVSAIVELEAVRLLLDLFNLPDRFLGGFVTGATMSNFTCLAVARQLLGKELGKDFAKEGVTGSIPILTATPHSSVVKSLALLGLGSNNIVNVKTVAGNREAMDMIDLKEKITELKGQAFILCSSGGTVNTVDFDDFVALAKLKKEHRFWWHIDAAFGGFATCSAAHKHLLKDWEYADSITVDCHKWLNVPYENAVFFVKEEHRLLQIETFQNSSAPYLGDPYENFNYLNLLPENSRRLKALPVWFTLMAYGKEGYRDMVENCIALSKKLGAFVEKSDFFELLAPVRLNTVCFTLKNESDEDEVHTFLSALNDTGKVFMTPTVYKGKKGIRAAMVNWMTKEEDVKLVCKLMKKIAAEQKK